MRGYRASCTVPPIWPYKSCHDQAWQLPPPLGLRPRSPEAKKRDSTTRLRRSSDTSGAKPLNCPPPQWLNCSMSYARANWLPFRDTLKLGRGCSEVEARAKVILYPPKRRNGIAPRLIRPRAESPRTRQARRWKIFDTFCNPRKKCPRQGRTYRPPQITILPPAWVELFRAELISSARSPP